MQLILIYTNTNRFIELYRLNKSNFMDVFHQIEPRLKKARRYTRIEPIIRFSAAMRFFATGMYQRCTGEEYNTSMSQTMVHESITEMVIVLESSICPKWIKFPKTEAEKSSIKKRFFEKTKMPGVLGCVDGTHVKILAPAENEHLYVDRMGNHSINVQLVKKHCLILFNIVIILFI